MFNINYAISSELLKCQYELNFCHKERLPEN